MDHGNRNCSRIKSSCLEQALNLSKRLIQEPLSLMKWYNAKRTVWRWFYKKPIKLQGRQVKGLDWRTKSFLI